MSEGAERLLVQCPHCGATFRVAQKTLAKAQGWAICGECFEPFDAAAHQIAAPAPPASAPSPQASVPEPEPALTDPLLERTAPASPAEQPLRADTTPPSTPDPVSSAATAPAASPRSEPPLAASIQPQPAGTRPIGASLPDLPASPSLLARLITLLLLLLLLATALWQLLLVAHTPLIRLYPALYPHWSAICQQVGCTVAPPADREHLRVEDARLIKEPEPARYTLEVTLANTAPYPMVWPHLAITLTDGLGRALVRKTLTPAEWGAPADRPMAPRQRLAVTLTWQTVESGIVGFEVVPFYPYLEKGG